jgi:hypothetical protein
VSLAFSTGRYFSSTATKAYLEVYHETKLLQTLLHSLAIPNHALKEAFLVSYFLFKLAPYFVVFECGALFTQPSLIALAYMQNADCASSMAWFELPCLCERCFSASPLVVCWNCQQFESCSFLVVAANDYLSETHNPPADLFITSSLASICRRSRPF